MDHDEQIDCQEFIDFVYGEGTVPKLPLAPGLYQYLADKSRFAWNPRFAIVKRSGHMYLVSFKEGEELLKSIGTNIEDLWPDISLYQRQSEIVTESRIRGSDIVKILAKKEFERITQPRPFSICLAGRYEIKDVRPPDPLEQPWDPDYDCRIEPESIVVSPSGSVTWYSSYELWYEKEDWMYQRAVWGGWPELIGEMEVQSVSRSPDKWSLKLHPGEEPRIEVVYPPLCVLQLSNGKSVDLSECGFSGKSALLSSTQISYHGKVIETEGSECIVSFPGRYADGWRECVEASTHDMGVACVFLCGKEDGWGEHADDPDAGGSTCYCQKIYGQRDFKAFGFTTVEECKKNGNRPTWGCLWFQKWRDNIEVAVKRKQRLIVYFFAGQKGQGLVAWDDLATANLWDGKGLGGSQKGDLDLMDQMMFIDFWGFMSTKQWDKYPLLSGKF